MKQNTLGDVPTGNLQIDTAVGDVDIITFNLHPALNATQASNALV